MTADAEPAGTQGLHTIHELVGRRIASAPYEIAVVDGADSMTYQQLDRTADAFAAQLHLLGVGPGSLVPVRLPKSADLIAVLLGILRLGAAYSVIGLDWPARRAEHVLRRLGSPVLVGDHVEGPGGWLVPAWWPSDPGGSAEYPTPSDSPEDAYAVFFTSGTTGEPKGVISPHAGLTRVLECGSSGDFRVGRAAAQSLAMPWDFASLEIWATLTSGAALVLVHDRFLTAARLRTLRAEHSVDTLFLATSVFKAIVEDDRESFDGFERVIVGGEAMPARHCATLLERFPRLRIVNGYGPVEVGLFATSRTVTVADTESGEIPIGSAIERTRLLVDDSGRSCSPGEIGELLVAGPGNTRGYLGDPDLTAARFESRTVNGVPTAFYRTGDLVVSDASGVLSFRGRADRQVKISGLRVDPSEVEALVCLTPGVHASAVVCRPGGSGRGQSLVAFFVGRPEATPAQVADTLAREAAEFQIPATILKIDAIPLNANGKVDQAALLRLAEEYRTMRTEAADRRDDAMTGAVLTVVGDCLGIPSSSVSHTARFVELGARSLDFGRISARLARWLGASVPLSVTFDNDTVASLAAWARAREQAVPVAAPTAMTPTQSHILTDTLRDPETADHNCMFAWRVDGHLDPAVLGSTFDHLHRTHESLRSSYSFRQGPRVTTFPIRPPALTVAHAQDRAEALRLLRVFGSRVFSPRQGRVWFPFAVLVGGNPGETLFGLSAHHVAVDGASAQTLASDIGDLYHQLTLGAEPSVAPAATVATLAEVRAQSMRGVDRTAQAEFWVTKLADLPALTLPPGDGHGVATVSVELLDGLHQRASALARRLDVTPFSIYLTALARTMTEMTGADDFGVLTAIDQRADSRLRRAVGCLIATVCVRPRSPGDRCLDDAVRSVAAEVQAAFSAQDTFFLDGIEAGESFRKSDRFRTMFILQDSFHSAMSVGGRVAQTFPAPYPGIPADLLVEVVPRLDTGVALYVHSRRSHVDSAFCQALAARTAARLHEWLR